MKRSPTTLLLLATTMLGSSVVTIQSASAQRELPTPPPLPPVFDFAPIDPVDRPPPTAPSLRHPRLDFGTSASEATVTLEWFYGGEVTAYIVERSADGVVFAQVASVDAEATQWSDEAVSLQGPIAYRVRAANGAEETDNSRIVYVEGTTLTCSSATSVEENVCPPECTGGCTDGVCNISCGRSECRDAMLHCPDGMPCKLACDGLAACSDSTFVCNEDQPCFLECADEVNCGGLTMHCGDGSCQAECLGFHGPDLLDCGGSADCRAIGCKHTERIETRPNPLRTCPEICNGGCDGNKCTIFCGDDACSDQTKVCPEGMHCDFLCDGFVACKDAVLVCDEASSCGLFCSSDVATCSGVDLVCGTGACNVECANFIRNPETVDCGNSSSCVVDPDCNSTTVVNNGGAGAFLECPPQCTGGCDGETCIIACGEGECKRSYVACPQDRDCLVQCSGDDSCEQQQIICPDDRDCRVDCGGYASCEEALILTMEPERTQVLCNGSSAGNCPDIRYACMKTPLRDSGEPPPEPPPPGQHQLTCSPPTAAEAACPEMCNGGCEAGVCVIRCDGDDCRDKQIACPVGMECKFVCEECRDSAFICDATQPCSMECTGRCSSTTLLCGSGPCAMMCPDDVFSPDLLDCGNSTNCTLDPECFGTDQIGYRGSEPALTCGPECTGGCDGNRCLIDCTEPFECVGDTIECPIGMECSLWCAPQACLGGTLSCADGQECELVCGSSREVSGDSPMEEPPVEEQVIIAANPTGPAPFAGPERICGFPGHGLLASACPDTQVEFRPPVACPPECTGGCADNICHIACDELGACTSWDPVVCATGMPCDIDCSGAGACGDQYLACPIGQPCNVRCTGVGSCIDSLLYSHNASKAEVTCTAGENCPNISYACTTP